MVLALAHQDNSIECLSNYEVIQICSRKRFLGIDWIVEKVAHTNWAAHFFRLFSVKLTRLNIESKLEFDCRFVVCQVFKLFVGVCPWNVLRFQVGEVSLLW